MENQKDSHKDGTEKDKDGPKDKAVGTVLGDIEKQFGKGASCGSARGRRAAGGRRRLDGLAGAGHRARDGRAAARPDRRDLRARVVGQDDAGAARRRRGAARGRHRARSSTPSTRWTSATRASWACKTEDLLVSQPDSGEQALEITEMLVRSEAVDVDRRRLGRGAGAEGRARGRDGRLARGAAGAADEPGAAQAHRRHRARQHAGHLHQPAPHEDRRDVRQPGDDDRRQRAEVLRVGAPRHPAHRRAEGRRAGGGQPHAREGGEEQDGAAVPRGRVRRPLRRRGSRGRARSSTWASRRACWRRAAPGSPTAASASATGARRPGSTCSSTRTC